MIERSSKPVRDDRLDPGQSPPTGCHGKKGAAPQALGRSRGGLTTKIYLLCDALGRARCRCSNRPTASPRRSLPTKATTPMPYAKLSARRRSKSSSLPEETEDTNPLTTRNFTSSSTSSSDASENSKSTADLLPATTETTHTSEPSCAWTPPSFGCHECRFALGSVFKPRNEESP